MRPIPLATIAPMLLLGAVPLAAQSLDRQEQRLRESITAAREEQIVYLQRVVDIPSSTLNFAGVRKVGAVFRASFDSLGFTTSWAAVPAAARRALLEAAQHSDVALAFEAGNRSDVTVARRGASAWRVTATGRQAHSAGVFGEGAGYGAIYEVARILDAFRAQLVGEQYLTFNAATIVGGTDVTYDTVAISGTTASKLNIVPSHAIAHGDLRFISAEQLQRTRDRMRAIVAQHLPGTDATIVFRDEYPAMSPTP